MMSTTPSILALLVDNMPQLVDDSMPPLVDEDSDDDMPPLVDEDSDDDMPPLVDDSDDDMPLLADANFDLAYWVYCDLNSSYPMQA